jgi:GNAT superfamily N-acetyltransferase
VVRLWDGSDVERIAGVSAAAGELFAEFGVPLPPDDPVPTLLGARAVLVEGEPVHGFAALGVVDGNAHLEELGVHPDHGRRGVGGRLLGASLEWARLRGFTALTLTTFRDLPFNGPWYARHGFVELPRERWGAELRAVWAAEEPIRTAPRTVLVRS